MAKPRDYLGNVPGNASAYHGNDPFHFLNDETFLLRVPDQAFQTLSEFVPDETPTEEQDILTVGLQNVVAICVAVGSVNGDLCGGPVRAVFMDKRGHLFGVIMADNHAGEPPKSGCIYRIESGAAFYRLIRDFNHPLCTVIVVTLLTKQSGPFAVSHGVFLQDDHLLMFSSTAVNAAFSTGQALLTNDTTSSKAVGWSTDVHWDVCKFSTHDDRASLLAAGMAARIQLFPHAAGSATESSDDSSDDSSVPAPLLKDCWVTLCRLSVRSTLAVSSAMDRNQPDNCECLDKLGIMGCLANHMPPATVADLSVAHNTVHFLRVQPTRTSDFLPYYARLFPEIPHDYLVDPNNCPECLFLAIKNYTRSQRGEPPLPVAPALAGVAGGAGGNGVAAGGIPDGVGSNNGGAVAAPVLNGLGGNNGGAVAAPVPDGVGSNGAAAGEGSSDGGTYVAVKSEPSD